MVDGEKEAISLFQGFPNIREGTVFENAIASIGIPYIQLTHSLTHSESANHPLVSPN